MFDRLQDELSIDIQDYEPIIAGVAQETFKITSDSGREYFLKYSTNDHDQGRIYSSYIRQARYVPPEVPKPELIDCGFKSEFAYTLSEYCESVTPYEWWDSDEFLETTASELGKIAHILHQRNTPRQSGYDTEIEHMVSDALKYIMRTRYSEYVSDLKTIRQELTADSPTYRFCHRDLHLGNLRLDKEGHIRAVTDWEHCRWTHPMYELAKIEVRFLDRFHTRTSLDPADLRENLRYSYGNDLISTRNLYALKLVQAIRNLGYMHQTNPFYPWNELASQEDVEQTYVDNIERYLDRFYQEI